MSKIYFKVAWRNLVRNKVSSIINIGGLTVGIAVAMLIGLWIYHYRTDLSWWIFALAGTAAIAITRLTVSFHAIESRNSKSGENFNNGMKKELGIRNWELVFTLRPVRSEA